MMEPALSLFANAVLFVCVCTFVDVHESILMCVRNFCCIRLIKICLNLTGMETLIKKPKSQNNNIYEG